MLFNFYFQYYFTFLLKVTRANVCCNHFRSFIGMNSRSTNTVSYVNNLFVRVYHLNNYLGRVAQYNKFNIVRKTEKRKHLPLWPPVNFQGARSHLLANL